MDEKYYDGKLTYKSKEVGTMSLEDIPSDATATQFARYCARLALCLGYTKDSVTKAFNIDEYDIWKI